MIFNSLHFAIFFMIVYFLYLALNHKWQNRMLLVASYVFYGTWDWRFLSLIVISTLTDYVCGVKICETENQKIKKQFLLISVFANLSILGFFKYFNFFSDNLQFLAERIGFQIQPHFFNIILPVGISFYTFQTMSYTIDIYKGTLKPTKKFLDFALFVSFFPQLVAGPIERAKHLLPQILSHRNINLNKLSDGCYLIFWGLFLKVFVADNLAKLVDPVFEAVPPYNGPNTLLAMYAFAFQIFGDFAGYSCIARGLGKCMGFEIMVNFNLPYFATNPGDFWRRWHISLSAWLRDYLYIPLGGNRKGTLITYRNLVITMLLGGLWHGAAWTFIVWGAYHGLLLIGHRILNPLFGKIPALKNIFLRSAWACLKVLFFFQLVCVGWLIFRAQSMSQFFYMVNGLFFNFSFPVNFSESLFYLMFFVTFLIAIQLFQYFKNDLMIVMKSPTYCRVAFALTIVCLCLYVVIFGKESGIGGGSEFIYFQF